MCIMIITMISRHEKSVSVSVLTWASLLLSTVHAVMSDWASLATVHCLPSPHQISLLLPVLTIFLQVDRLF